MGINKIYYFIGQPGSGKTTLANELKKHLIVNPIHIDGDDMRDIFHNKDYTENGRRLNINRAQDIATFLHAKHYTVIMSLVSPYRDLRDELKRNPNVIEIFVHTNNIRGKENFHVNNFENPIENFIDINTDDDIELTMKRLKDELKKR